MILDTNALSAMAEGESAIEPLLIKTDQATVPVIVLGEYRFGVSQSRERSKYERWMDEYLPRFQFLNIDEQTSRYYADLRVELKKIGRPIPSNDVWIAALCRQHSLPILSRDRHFDGVPGITRIGW